MKGQATIVERLKAYAGQRDFPHLLFAGPPGTGKTTAALALARDVFQDSGIYSRNLLEMNASDERGLQSVRTKVKEFARMAPDQNVPFKLIFLDEADALTPDAQGALRRIMEQYAGTCRFILSCNYSSKIGVRSSDSGPLPRTRSWRWSRRLRNRKSWSSRTMVPQLWCMLPWAIFEGP